MDRRCVRFAMLHRPSIAGLALCTMGLELGAPANAAVIAALPSRSEVLAVMSLVADRARQLYPADAEAYWDEGVYHVGMMAFQRASGSEAALAYSEAFGNHNQWRLDRDVVAANRHNRLAAAQSWVTISSVSTVADLEDVRTEIADQTSLSLAAVTSDAYFAVDAQFMALPAFAMVGRLDDEPGYFRRLYELFEYNKTTLGLYDADAGLYFRDVNYLYPDRQTPNGKKVFWSRGNGWAFAALACVLAELPMNDPARDEYVATFRAMAAALTSVQRSDGLWNMSLDDPNHHPGPETSGTALFAYGMAWGINKGLLSKAQYGSVVARAWKGMVNTAVHPDGRLGYVQGIGQQPVPPSQVTYESTAEFGVGVFLLAGSEVAKLTVDGEKYEVEDLPATVSSGDAHQRVDDPWASSGEYDRGLFNAVDDYIEYTVSIPEAGAYNVKVRFAEAADLGRWRFYTAGGNVGAQQNSYSEDFRFAEVSLGNVTYQTPGPKVFRFTVTGKSRASRGHDTSIDYVMLTRK